MVIVLHFTISLHHETTTKWFRLKIKNMTTKVFSFCLTSRGVYLLRHIGTGTDGKINFSGDKKQFLMTASKINDAMDFVYDEIQTKAIINGNEYKTKNGAIKGFNKIFNK